MWRVLAILISLAAAAAAQRSPRKPAASAPAPAVVNLQPLTTTSHMSASPASITFTSTDPDSGAVSGSSTATVTWRVSGGATTRNWTLSLQASAVNMTNCSNVPVSAVKVTCASATYSGGGGTGACSSAFNLSNALQTVASGKEGTGNRSATVTVNFSFTDQWSYVAHTAPACGVALTYSVTNP
ncbi:MAG TPA: hypothetical protein VMU19_14940 [Bryobacteraceae bacterium]|nr:hypothetical protein [Bryobacteraceae bacterium]